MSANRQQNDKFKDYVPVAERIAQFHEDWPAGRVLTAIVEHDAEQGRVLFRAEVYREMAEELPSATGHAYESRGAMPQHMQASYVEVCESSAVGRALMLLGYETKRTGEERPRGPRAVERQPPRNLNAEIMTALEAYGKTEDELNDWTAKKWGVSCDWTELPADRKEAVITYLNNQINKRSAE